MSDSSKTDMAEKQMASDPASHVADGQTLVTSTSGAHTKIKPRHLYMIAMGGKRLGCRDSKPEGR